MDNGIIESIIDILRSFNISTNYEKRNIYSDKQKKQLDNVILKCFELIKTIIEGNDEYILNQLFDKIQIVDLLERINFKLEEKGDFNYLTESYIHN